jgi:RimJ/RimL family protein N-acetyltransferase
VELTLSPTELNDGTILLRHFEPGDVGPLLGALNDPAITDPADLSLPRPVSRASVELLVSRLAPSWLETGSQAFVAIASASSNECVGGALLRKIDRGKGTCEVGFFVVSAMQRRGIATRAARLLSDWALGLGLTRVEALALVENTASHRVLERAGFTREPALRSAERSRGGTADFVVFAKPS